MVGSITMNSAALAVKDVLTNIDRQAPVCLLESPVALIFAKF